MNITIVHLLRIGAVAFACLVFAWPLLTSFEELSMIQSPEGYCRLNLGTTDEPDYYRASALWVVMPEPTPGVRVALKQSERADEADLCELETRQPANATLTVTTDWEDDDPVDHTGQFVDESQGEWHPPLFSGIAGKGLPLLTPFYIVLITLMLVSLIISELPDLRRQAHPED